MSTKNVKKTKSGPGKHTEKKLIKLRLNYRTVVTVKSDAALKAWMEKYPEATVI